MRYENSIDWRGQRRRYSSITIGLYTAFSGILPLVLGCHRNQVKVPQGLNNDLTQVYLSINLKNLSEDEERFIKTYDWKNLSETDRKFASGLGMDPNNLSDREKAFLLKIAGAMQSTGLQYNK